MNHPQNTSRLNFRQASDADAAFMLALLTEPSWRKFISDHKVDSVESALTYLQERIISGYGNGLGFWVLELQGEGRPVGICGLIKRDYLKHIDLGFALLERFWGQGFAAEAARSTVDYGFDSLALEQLLAVTLPSNVISIRLLEHLGFSHSHNTRDPNDEDVAVYGLSNASWKAHGTAMNRAS